MSDRNGIRDLPRRPQTGEVWTDRQPTLFDHYRPAIRIGSQYSWGAFEIFYLDEHLMPIDRPSGSLSGDTIAELYEPPAAS
jgi:hypothetical protein